MNVPGASLLAAAALLGVLSLVAWRRRRRQPSRWTPTGRLAGIRVYPLKSGGGGRHYHRAQVTRLGLRRGAVLDRCLALVCNGKMLSVSERRRLVLIQADITDDTVTLTAPQMTPLTVKLPQDGDGVIPAKAMFFGYQNTGADLGPVAARWMGDYFNDGKDYTLMYFLPEATTPRRVADMPKPYVNLASAEDVATYNNVTAVSVLCSASLDELNSRLETPVTFDNFRQNLIVDGAPAFDDDTWDLIRIGSTVMRRIKPINRCFATCVDPKTGGILAKSEPLRTLRTFRLPRTAEEKQLYKEAPLFGSCLGVDVEGEVAVGDTVYVLRK